MSLKAFCLQDELYSKSFEKSLYHGATGSEINCLKQKRRPPSALITAFGYECLIIALMLCLTITVWGQVYKYK